MRFIYFSGWLIGGLWRPKGLEIQLFTSPHSWPQSCAILRNENFAKQLFSGPHPEQWIENGFAQRTPNGKKQSARKWISLFRLGNNVKSPNWELWWGWGRVKIQLVKCLSLRTWIQFQGDSSMDKVLAMWAWELDFDLHHSWKNQGCW